MKLHLVGLPHTQTTTEASVCAFTQKIVKFGKMMVPRGWEIVLYSGEHNETPCSEHVTLFSDADQEKWYGSYDANTLPSLATWDSMKAPWMVMNHRAIAAISERIEEGDLILVTGGKAQKAISDAFQPYISAEWAAGYSGIYLPYVCFESYAWQSFLYGQISQGGGRFYDAVIPNFFDLDEWKVPKNTKRGDNLLFVGRLIAGKGLQVAHEIAQHSGRKLVIAGSGMAEYTTSRGKKSNKLVCEDGTTLEGNVEYVGTVGGTERTKLMREAYALLAPTTYIEPFGAVAVEAQLVGTPVITTDWGAFPETVVNGLSGYRIRSLRDGIDAVEKVGDLDRALIEKEAKAKYSLEVVAPLYENWFARLSSLYGAGWYDVDGRLDS